MKTFRKLVEILLGIETRWIRARTAKRATRYAFRIALNRCRV